MTLCYWQISPAPACFQRFNDLNQRMNNVLLNIQYYVCSFLQQMAVQLANLIDSLTPINLQSWTKMLKLILWYPHLLLSEKLLNLKIQSAWFLLNLKCCFLLNTKQYRLLIFGIKNKSTLSETMIWYLC